MLAGADLEDRLMAIFTLVDRRLSKIPFYSTRE